MTAGRFHPRVCQPRHRAGDPGPLQGLQGQAVPQEGRALRTETTVKDTRDFGIGRLLTQDNWSALVGIGHEVNERLLTAQLEACACAPGATTLERVVLASKEDGQPAPGLRSAIPA